MSTISYISLRARMGILCETRVTPPTITTGMKLRRFSLLLVLVELLAT